MEIGGWRAVMGEARFALYGPRSVNRAGCLGGCSSAKRDRVAARITRFWARIHNLAFIFWLPFECSANARGKQLVRGPDTVQKKYSGGTEPVLAVRNRSQPVLVATDRFRTGFFQLRAY